MIPAEAVEAAAEAINLFAAKYVGVLDPVPLNDMSWLDREHALDEARAALEAAAPFIMAQAFDEGQKSGMRHADRLVAAAKIGKPDLPGALSPNPYRPTP